MRRGDRGEDALALADRLVRQAEAAWRRGDGREAEALCGAALAAVPHHVDGLHLLALVDAAAGRRERALARLDLALRLAPGDVRLHATAAEVLDKLGRAESALTHWEQAVALAPGEAALHQGHGAALHRAGRYEQAAAAFERVVALMPGLAGGWSNLAETCRVLDRFEPAVAHARRAVALAPQDRGSRYNLALALSDAGAVAEAEALLRALLAERPADAEAEFELAKILLRQGRWAAGWRAYESRYRMPHTQGLLPRFTAPLWDGRELPGRTLLVFAEQGFGDTLQFARFLPQARARVGRLVLGMSPQLRSLFEGHPAADETFVDWTAVPAHAAQVPIASLGLCVGGDDVSMPGPYLTPPAAARERAARLLRLAALDRDGAGLKIGLVWSGRAEHQYDRRRTIPLAALAALAQLDGVSFVALQTGPREAEALAWPGPAPLFLAGPYLRDFGDTAAVVERLDLVLSVDTAVVHLAGALVVPAWVLLSQPCDWRWGDAAPGSAWYPTLRLFRQDRPGDWATLVETVCAALAQRADAKDAAPRQGP